MPEGFFNHTDEEKPDVIRDKIFAFNRAFPLSW